MKKKEFLKIAQPLNDVFLKGLRRSLRFNEVKQETIAEMMQTSAGHISERMNAHLDIDVRWLCALSLKLEIPPSQLIDLKALDAEYMKIVEREEKNESRYF